MEEFTPPIGKVESSKAQEGKTAEFYELPKEYFKRTILLILTEMKKLMEENFSKDRESAKKVCESSRQKLFNWRI